MADSSTHDPGTIILGGRPALASLFTHRREWITSENGEAKRSRPEIKMDDDLLELYNERNGLGDVHLGLEAVRGTLQVK